MKIKSQDRERISHDTLEGEFRRSIYGIVPISRKFRAVDR